MTTTHPEPQNAMNFALLQHFAQHFDYPATHFAHAPGRVNLIGEHTDYNDGFVLPCAIDFCTQVALRPRSDSAVRVLACNFDNAADHFNLDFPIAHHPDSSWHNYVRGVVSTLQHSSAQPLLGMDMAIVGNVPQGTGLSSSASLEVALLAGIGQLQGLPLTPQDWAILAKKSENQFVGTQCGIMDMWISATAATNSASLIDCRSLQSTPHHVPDQLQLLIINSKVKRGLVDSHYNQRRQQCEQAARFFGVPALRDVAFSALMDAQNQLDPLIFRRARHVVTENARTLAMAAALASDDIPQISHLMRASHQSMRDDFEITVPAIDHIVEIIHGVLGQSGGVRMTGGGFGGCVVALVPHALVAECQRQLTAYYRSPDGELASVYQPHISAGAWAKSL